MRALSSLIAALAFVCVAAMSVGTARAADDDYPNRVGLCCLIHPRIGLFDFI